MMLQQTAHLMHHRTFRIATHRMLTNLMQRPKRQSAWKADATKGLLFYSSYHNTCLRRGQCCEAPERCPGCRIPGLQNSRGDKRVLRVMLRTWESHRRITKTCIMTSLSPGSQKDLDYIDAEEHPSCQGFFPKCLPQNDEPEHPKFVGHFERVPET